MDLRGKFFALADSFLDGREENDCNIKLKKQHTLRVAAAAEKIATAEKLTEEEHICSLYSAWLHDVSRFEQFRRFGTFNDGASFDHGERSAELVEELGFIRNLPQEQQQAVIFAVKSHNKRELPPPPSGLAETAAKIVRDADKLDIFRVLLDYLDKPDNPAVIWGLPESSEVTPEVAAALLQGRCPDNRYFASRLDFLISKAGWAFDLNTRCAKDIFRQKEFLQKLEKQLPETPLTEKIFLKANEDLKR